MNKDEQSLRDLWNTIKQANMSNTSPRKEKKGAGKIFEEIIAANVLNLVKAINVHIQETKKTQNRMNTKRSTAILGQIS